jgi:hypothetical protein
MAPPLPHAGGARPSLERGGVSSTHPRDLRLRRVLSDGNEVVSQCKNACVDNRALALAYC